MLHNLKNLATSQTSKIVGTNAVQCTAYGLTDSVFFRTIARYTTGLIRCWQCSNENSSAGIQFKCTKCQSLLELPNDVVWKLLYCWIWNIFIENRTQILWYRFLSRITFNCCALIKDLISIQKHWRNNFDKFRMCYTPINLVKGKLNKLKHSNWISESVQFLFICGSSEKEQHLSAEWSSLVNRAYKILLSPIQRAEYLLKSHNIEVSESNTTSDKQFLLEMMERNEEVGKHQLQIFPPLD